MSTAANGDLSEQEYADWRAGNDWYNAAYAHPSDVDPSVYDGAGTRSRHGIACVRVEADDPGRTIYEDDVQVVVVPHTPDVVMSFQPQSDAAVTRGPRASVVCQSSE